MFSSVAVHWAPELVAGFTAQYPNIEVELFSGLYHEVENRVIDERLDCGFLTKKLKHELDFSELTQDRLLAVLPLSHPMAKCPLLPAGAIGREDFIIPGEGTEYDIGEIFKVCRITPRVKYTLSDDYAALAMVERGLGMTILPELILKGRAANAAVMELDPPFRRTIGLVTRPGRLISPAARAFIEYAKAHI